MRTPLIIAAILVCVAWFTVVLVLILTTRFS